MNTIAQLGRIAARETVKAAQPTPESYSHVPANPTNIPARDSNMSAKPWHQPWAPEPASFNQPQVTADPLMPDPFQITEQDPSKPPPMNTASSQGASQ